MLTFAWIAWGVVLGYGFRVLTRPKKPELWHKLVAMNINATTFPSVLP